LVELKRFENGSCFNAGELRQRYFEGAGEEMKKGWDEIVLISHPSSRIFGITWRL
jgi:hypothetical protein